MQTEISSAHNWTALLNAACKNVEGLLGKFMALRKLKQMH
jgi:hypothetical protein